VCPGIANHVTGGKALITPPGTNSTGGGGGGVPGAKIAGDITTEANAALGTVVGIVFAMLVLFHWWVRHVPCATRHAPHIV
jgi:hypothetical protein